MWRIAVKCALALSVLLASFILTSCPAVAQVPLLGFKMTETPVPTGPDRAAIEAAGFTNPVTYRFSVCFSDPGWQLLSSGGESIAEPFIIQSNDQFYQHPNGSALGDDINPTLYTFFPGLRYDSWVTIKYDETGNPGSGTQFVPTTAYADFESNGGNIIANAPPGALFYVIPAALDEPQSLPDANNSILLGQFTVSSGTAISCAMSLQFRLIPASPTDLPFVTQEIYTAFGTSDNLDELCVELFLPLDITAFNAYATQEHIALEWETQSENNSDYFEIFRSTDTENWTSLGQIAAAGQSQSLIRYLALDREPTIGVNYYKIRQVNQDGSSFDSDVLPVSWRGSNLVSIYPNPSKDVISIDGDLSGFESMTLVSSAGKTVWDSGDAESLEDLRLLNTSVLNLADGIYFMRLGRPNGSFEQHMISIAK